MSGGGTRTDIQLQTLNNRSKMSIDEGELQIDDLNSTGEIMAAHDVIENKLNLISHISSPSLATNRTFPLQFGDPRKQAL